MLRKKPSIHRLNIIITSSFSQVTSSSPPFSNRALYHPLKTSHSIHQRYRSSATSAERSVPPADPNPDGSYHQNPFGSDSLAPGSFQKSSNGFYGRSSSEYQRSDFGDVGRANRNGFQEESSGWDQRGNLDGLRGGNSAWEQRSNLGEVRQVNSNRFSGENPVQSRRNLHGEVRQVNPSGFRGENSDWGQRSNIGEVRQVNLNGYRGEHSSLQYQRSHLGEVQQVIPNGFRGENLDWGQRSNLGVGSVVNNSAGYQSGSLGEVPQVNSGGYFADGSVGNQRNKHGEVQRPGSFAGHGENSVGYQRTDLGEVQQQNSDGFYRGNPALHLGSNFGDVHRTSSNGAFHQNSGFHGEHTQMANGHPGGNTNGGHSQIPMGTYNRNSGNNQEFSSNSNLWYGQQNPNCHPETYHNQSEINRESQHTSQQTPYGQCGGSPGYGYNRENPVPNVQQNSNESPFFGFPNINDESAQAGEMCSYKGTLSELDEFSNEGKVKEAVEVLSMLEENGVVIDLPRYLQLVQACGCTKSLEEGRIVHDRIFKAMGELGIGVHNKILDMYFKCGSADDAFQLFDKMPQRNLTTWDTMITGLANNNLGEEAIDLFLQFNEMGLKPDGDLFVAVFLSCGVLGSVKEGMLHFNSMTVDFGIAPTMKHYASIVDMLGRSGYLDEALEFIENMPIEASVDVWETLMNLCRVNGYEDLGDRCAAIVDLLDPSRLTEESRKGLLTLNDSSNAKTESTKKSNLLRGKSHIHEYRAGDRSNPEIYQQINILAPHMKEAGYVPDIKCVLHDVDEESREEALLYHSERLATAYGLLTSSARSPIRIIKNLRVCRDCHNAMKIMSKITGRLLIARDAKRFHHFENGVCSCKDFW